MSERVEHTPETLDIYEDIRYGDVVIVRSPDPDEDGFIPVLDSGGDDNGVRPADLSDGALYRFLANASVVPALLEALREIAKPEGPYSRDPLTHAVNVIEHMASIAKRAIARATGQEARHA